MAIYEREYSKKAEQELPKELWVKARRVLEALDSADELQDLNLYGLDEKTGDLSGLFSLRINDQYRVLFKWDEGEAHEVFAGDPEFH
jgi:proteic killer suppression protein